MSQAFSAFPPVGVQTCHANSCAAVSAKVHIAQLVRRDPSFQGRQTTFTHKIAHHFRSNLIIYFQGYHSSNELLHWETT